MSSVDVTWPTESSRYGMTGLEVVVGEVLPMLGTNGRAAAD
jgi:hypothetical protein